MAWTAVAVALLIAVVLVMGDVPLVNVELVGVSTKRSVTTWQYAVNAPAMKEKKHCVEVSVAICDDVFEKVCGS